jgi:hypothetical protein
MRRVLFLLALLFCVAAAPGVAETKLPVAYLSSRTRPTSAVWNVLPECGIFRDDGLAVYGSDHHRLWIPWSAIDYFLPRMRIVRLRGGAEFQTPYAQKRRW